MEQENVEMAISTTIYGWFLEQWLNKGQFDIYNNGDGREGTPTEVAFIENGGMEKALTAWKEGVDNGAMPNVGREGGQPEFVSGQSAMTLASTANLNQILTEVGDRFEVGTAYYPAIDAEDEGGVSIGGASLWMVDTGDEAKMDATWDFIQYLVSPAVQAQWNVDTGYFPVTQEAHSEQVFQDNLEEYPQFQTAIDQLHDATPEDQAGISGVNQEARMIMEAELENVLNENSTIEEGAAAMAEQINSALETYNRTNNAGEEE
jgi:sn-glycerol 3-phosphate transport system substrate-binding protein